MKLMRHWWLLVVAACCLVAMLPGLPYGYFMLLRVLVCSACICNAVNEIGSVRQWLGVSNIAVLVLFNPIFKIHLPREVWWCLDGVAGVWLIACTVMLSRSSAN